MGCKGLAAAGVYLVIGREKYFKCEAARFGSGRATCEGWGGGY